MEGDSKSAVIIETGQEIGTLDVNKSGEAELLSDSQNELQGAVIIYDNESQEGQVVKLITNIKSEDNASDQNPDPDNVITLHASSNDSKDETIENILALPSQQTIKTEAVANPEGDGGEGEDAEDEDDDETIATFVTSTGQQLALYAVEDSDEIFAVALYDESGEPPTNFHFLMKSDVERLIGEGAVKTVKKPSAQAKKEIIPAVEKKEEEIKFEKVATERPVTPVPVEKKEDILEKSLAGIKEVRPVTPVPVEKKEDILEKSLAGIKQEIMEVSSSPEKIQEVLVPVTPSPPKVQQEVVKVVQKKEPPAAKFVVNKNNSINNTTVKNVTPTAAAKKPVTQIRHIVTQAKPVTPQTKVVTTPNRTYATYQSRPTQVVKQIITPGRQLVTTQQPRQIVQRQIISQQPPRQIITQQRQIIGQPTRQIVTQQRKIIAQSTRQVVAQQQPTRQLVMPARQYVNQKQYGRQPHIVYQAKPQQMRTAVTPIKKQIVASQKEKITYVVQNQEESYVLDLDSDAEILEQSTVQYILCDENPTDTECLTFDELQASIQSFKTGKSPVPATTTTTTTKIELPKPKIESSPAISKFLPTVRSTPKPATILTPKKQQPITTTSITPQVYRTYKSPKKARTTNNLLQANRKIIKQEVVDPSYGDFDDTHDMSDADVSQSRPNSTLDSSSGVNKAKRSRKQQLTVVNRGDSEIIIQPAPAYSEEEEEPLVSKRRGRRKKKSTPDPDYNPRQQQQKKGRRSVRSVEVIDIDVDEAERANVITLDGKKGSSDKENDVISVEDTDEEDDGVGPRKKKVMRKPMMQCSHCMRNFRKRRALEKHVQICPKSPAYLEKLEERKKLGVDKKFKCKSCNEYFDIAVALARHVRVVHSPRKRGRPPKGWAREDKSETDVTDESMDESSPEREVVVGPKKRGRPPRKSSVVADKEIVTADVVEKSPAPEGESKSETPSDGQKSEPQPSSSSEPRRRGRPPGKRSFYVERSVTPEVQEDKTASGDSSTRKRGRAIKRSMSQEVESEDIEGDASESSTLPKKRGRPKKKSMSKDDETDNPEGEDKIEDASSTEPKPRGRRSRRTMSKDEEDARSTASEDKLEDESSKKRKTSEDESDKNEPTKKRGRPVRDKLISIKEEKMIESSEAETESEEPKKRGRPSRSSESEASKKIKPEVEEMEEVVLSPSQTGKLKKLNCSECGKWFSSVSLLNNHQIEHRTKKSGILVNRCPDCNALVPINLFVKHMAMQHKKTVQVASTSKADGTSSTQMTITTQVQSADNKTVKIVQQRSLRSSN